MPVPLTKAVGEFVSNLRYEDIPKPVIPTVHTGFTDCVGVLIGGAREPAAQLLKSTLAPAGRESSVLFDGSRTSAPDAAWINGTAAHAMDFDDVALNMWGHPSTVLVPAILAEAEAIDASGRDMVVAYVAGYETWAELVRRDRDLYIPKGWHPTGLFGALGAAAACASLLKLHPEQAATAVSIAASKAAGLAANWGTMTKPFHAGCAAQSGVIAARLAKAGFTASLDTLERQAGFLSAISPAGRFDAESPIELGRDWKLIRNGLHIKKYPLCFATHRALDGILDVLQSHDVDAKGVTRVTVSTCPRGVQQLRYSKPQLGLEAKFSMEFAMASALIARRAGLTELSDDFVQRPDVQSLMDKVVVTPDEREDPALPGWAIYDQVTIESKAGRVESARVNTVRGGPEAPIRPTELWAKFQSCLEAGSAAIPSRPLFDSLMSLDRLPRASALPGIGA